MYRIVIICNNYGKIHYKMIIYVIASLYREREFFFNFRSLSLSLQLKKNLSLSENVFYYKNIYFKGENNIIIYFKFKILNDFNINNNYTKYSHKYNFTEYIINK